MIEKRKNIRFNVKQDSFIQKESEIFFLENISLSGIKASNCKTSIGTIQAVSFFYKNQNFGIIKIKKVNQQGTSGGWEILESSDSFKDIFNPNLLLKKIKIKQSKDNLEYRDNDFGLIFNFIYDDDKKIIKSIVSFRGLGVVLEPNSLKSFTENPSHCDELLNNQTVVLIKKIIQESNCFVSSFKEWLVDSMELKNFNN